MQLNLIFGPIDDERFLESFVLHFGSQHHASALINLDLSSVNVIVLLSGNQPVNLTAEHPEMGQIVSKINQNGC